MATTDPRQQRGRGRVLRGLLKAFMLLLGVAVVVVAAAVIFSQTAAFHRWLRDQVVTRANAALNGQVRIGSLEGDLFGSLEIRDLDVNVEGNELAAVRRVTASYDLLSLVTRRQLVLKQVAVEGVRAHLIEDQRGWNAARLVPPSANVQGKQAEAGPTLAVRLDDLVVHDADVDVVRPTATYKLDDMTLHASGRMDREVRQVRIETLSFVMPTRDLRLEKLSGDIELDADGALRAEHVVVKTAASSLQARARIAAGRQTYDAFVDLQQLSADEVHRLTGGTVPAVDLSATLQARGPAQRLLLDGTALHSQAGEVGVTGTVDVSGHPYGCDLRIALQHFDAAGLLGPTRPKSDLTGTVNAQGKGTTLEDAAAVFTVALDNSRLRDTQFDRLALHGSIDHRQVALNGEAKTKAGDASVTANVDLPNEGYDLRLQATGLDPGPFLNRKGMTAQISGSVKVRGSGFHLQTARAEAELAIGPSRIEAVQIRRFDGLVRVADARLTIERLNLDSNIGTLTASGSTEVEGLVDRTQAGNATGRLRYALQLTDLRPLGQISHTAALAGSLGVNGTASGRLNDLDVNATVDARNLLVSGTRVGSVHADVNGRNVGSASGVATVAARAKNLAVGARPFAGARINATWRGAGLTHSQMAVDLVLHQDEKHEHTLSATAELQPEETRVAVQTLILQLGSETWKNTGVAQMRRRGERLAVSNFDLRSQHGEVTLDGEGGMAGEENLTATVRDFDLAPLVSGEPGDVKGRLSGRVHLAGTAEAPRVEGDIGIAQLTVENARYESAQAELHLARGDATAHVQIVQTGASQVVVDARLPVQASLAPFRFEMGQSLSGSVRANNIDLAVLQLATPQLTRVRGTLTADLSLSGPLRRPEIRGPLSLRGGRAYVVPLGLTYDPIELQLQFNGDAVQVDTLRLASGKGWLNGSGTAQLRPRGAAGAVNIELHEFPLFDNQYGEGRTSGWLWIGGSTQAPIIEGALETDRLVFRMPEKLPGPARPPDPTIKVVGPAAAESLAPPPDAVPPKKPTAGAGGPGLPPQASIHIQVDVPRNAWLRRSDADIELRGSITVWKRPNDQPRVAGDIETVRGWYTFQGKKFTVTEGQVTLTGQDFDPLLKVIATHQAGDYTVRITIGGRLTKPTIKLESDPPLQPADILAVLLFGKPANKLSRGESTGLQQQALGIAGGYVASEFRQSVANALGLDTLEVQPNAAAGGRGTSAAAGKYVSEDVFVSLAHKFAQQNIEELLVQYFFAPHWNVEATTDTLGNSGVDVFWNRKY